MNRPCVTLLTILLCAGLLVGACTDLLDVPDGPGAEGTIQIISDTLFPAEDPAGITELLVVDESVPEEECGRVIWGIFQMTTIGFARGDGLAEKASAEDLRVGQRIRVWGDGNPCSFGCPADCGAGYVLILDGG